MKLGIIALVAALALGGCQIPHKKHTEVAAPVAPVQVVKPTVESLDVRVTAIEKRLNDAKAYRERLARQRVQVQQ